MTQFAQAISGQLPPRLPGIGLGFRAFRVRGLGLSVAFCHGAHAKRVEGPSGR